MQRNSAATGEVYAREKYVYLRIPDSCTNIIIIIQ